jgi:hypothetical protein
MTVRNLIAFFGLGAALAFAQSNPLDNIASRQYQHEIRPLRLALDPWLHELGLQDAGLSIRLVKADDLPPNSCGMSTYDVNGLVGEIDVLRSDEYVNLPGCLDGVDVPKDQLNTVIHEVMHMVLDLHVSDEAKVVAISEVIQPRTRRHK